MALRVMGDGVTEGRAGETGIKHVRRLEHVGTEQKPERSKHKCKQTEKEGT